MKKLTFSIVLIALVSTAAGVYRLAIGETSQNFQIIR